MGLTAREFLLPGAVLSRYASLAGRHRRVPTERIVAEVDQFLSRPGRRHVSRYLLLPEEVVLYTLPLLREVATASDVTLAFLGRGAEPAFRALSQLSRAFGQHGIDERALLLPLVRSRAGAHCLSPSVVSAINREEQQREVTREQWEEIHQLVSSDRRDLDRWLVEKFGIQGGFPAVRRRGATLGSLLPLLVDWGVDERFLDFYARARSLRFADHFDLDEVGRFGETPVDAMSARLIRKLTEAASPDDRETGAILSAGRVLAGQGSTVGHVDQDLLLHYQRVAVLATEAGRLRHSLEHRARAAVSVLLRGTRISKLIRAKRVICVDHGVVSGSALLLAGLVVAAVHGRSARPVGTHVIAARTPWAAGVLIGSGLVDEVSTDRLWFHEDLNEFYSGFYHLDGPARRFVSFEVARRILELRLARSPEQGRFEDLGGRLNAGVDDLVGKLTSLDFVQRLPNLRGDPSSAQREVVKLHLRRRSGDPFSAGLQELITFDALASFHTFGDELAKKVLMRDHLRAVDQELSSTVVPPALPALDARCRDWDQLRHVLAWCVMERERDSAYAAAADALGHGKLRGGVLDYLAGRLEFDDVVRAFYRWMSDLPASVEGAHAGGGY